MRVDSAIRHQEDPINIARRAGIDDGDRENERHKFPVAGKPVYQELREQNGSMRILEPFLRAGYTFFNERLQSKIRKCEEIDAHICRPRRQWSHGRRHRT